MPLKRESQAGGRAWSPRPSGDHSNQAGVLFIRSGWRHAAGVNLLSVGASEPVVVHDLVQPVSIAYVHQRRTLVLVVRSNNGGELPLADGAGLGQIPLGRAARDDVA